MSSTTSQAIWHPYGDYLQCRMADFMHLHGISDCRQLIAKSTKEPEWFWATFLQFAGVRWHKEYTTVLDQSAGFAFANWFVGGQMNIAYNCLEWHLEAGKKAGIRESVGRAHPAIIWENEEGKSRTLSYGELDDLSGRVAALLSKLGVKAGDAVGIYMPMVPEVAAVLFGCFKLGAVAVPVFSGYGAQALAARLADAEAKVLFTADGGRRHGKLIEIKKDADEAAKQLPDLSKLVVLKHTGNPIAWNQSRDLWFSDGVEDVSPLRSCQELPAEHRSMYLYTSGTTGKPKGTVHTHVGVLAQVAKELGISFNTKPDDVFFWLTDIGWMMGPWEFIGCTYWGATMVLFEGAPNYPSPTRLWELVEKHKVSTLGISPTAIRVLKSTNPSLANFDLKSLRYLGSTGEPWDGESYMWFFEEVGGKRCPIINMSGGTEIMGCLIMPVPLMSLTPCSLGGPGLAMDVDVFDESGQSCLDAIGYLVCKSPSPSMTKGFLKDNERYLETYFKRFPGVWYHGDWAKVDEQGQWYLFGRSDDTIKVAGKRVGPAEVEATLIEHDAVTEAAVIGVPNDIKGESIVCFVVLLSKATASDQLAKDISASVSGKLGSMFRPEKIVFVEALPKTRSGKIVRSAMRHRYLGEAVTDVSAIENPDVLNQIPVASDKQR